MNVVIIPQKFSKYGVYTSSFVLLNSLVAFFHGHLILSGLLACLFVTSVINWSRMYFMSPIKILDILFACSCIMFVTLETSNSFTEFWRDVWIDYVLGSTLIFCINSAILYEEFNNSPNHVVSDTILALHVFTHLLFMHVMSTTICMIGIIVTPELA